MLLTYTALPVRKMVSIANGFVNICHAANGLDMCLHRQT